MRHNNWAEQKAAQLLSTEKSILKNWPLENLTIWLRDACRCVYCERDMLVDRGITYHLYHHDHILSVKKYPEFENATWNKVLSCRPCNLLKATFDPADAGIAANEESREKLIERAKKYIEEQRIPAEALFLKEREVLTTALREHEAGEAASA